MPFQAIRDLDGTIWLAGPPEASPPNTLRASSALHPVPTAGTARVRFGSTLVHNDLINIRTILGFGAFADAYFYAYHEQVFGTHAAAYFTDLHSTTLSAVVISPNAELGGQIGYLMVCGGFADRGLWKIDPIFGVPSKWGIDPPTTGPTAVVDPVLITQIDTMDSAAGWTSDGGVSSVTTNGTIKTQGAASLRVALDQNSTGTITKTGLTLDLTALPGAVVSPDEDWIGIAIRIDRPRRVEGITISFGNDSDFNRSFSFEITIDDALGRKRRKGKKKRGLGDVPGVQNNEEELLVTGATVPFKLDAAMLLGDVRASAADNTWAILKIPKLLFTADGDDPDWATITAMQISFETNRKGATVVFLDDVKLIGGFGLQGTYKYKTTFKNGTTGNRSNAPLEETVEPVEVEDVARQSITLSNLPVPTDDQVSLVEIWRTLGNGEVYFKVTEVPVGTTTFQDDYADYSGLHSATDHILSSEVLPTDNDPPEDNFTTCAIFQNRVFWTRKDEGRVYYSPAGRTESVQGFLDVGTLDNRAFRVVAWDDRLFVFCERDVHEIVGSTEPFLSRLVAGAPGAMAVRSDSRDPSGDYLYTPVVGTPVGLVYTTQEGPLLFSGGGVRRIGFENLAPRLRDETPIYHAHPLGRTRDEVYFRMQNTTDRTFVAGQSIFAWNWTSGRWRMTGLPDGLAMHYDERTATVRYAFGEEAPNGRVIDLDTANVYLDVETAIPFRWEHHHVVTEGSRDRLLVRYVVFKILTSGQIVTPTVIVDGVETVLPPCVTTTYEYVEYPINRFGAVVGLRLECDVTTGPVEITELCWDVHIAETHSAIAPSTEVPGGGDEPVRQEVSE